MWYSKPGIASRLALIMGSLFYLLWCTSLSGCFKNHLFGSMQLVISGVWGINGHNMLWQLGIKAGRRR